MNIRFRQEKSAFKNMKSILCNKNLTFKSCSRVFNCYIYSNLPTAQKHGIYPKPWNHASRHSRCGALGVCSEFHGEHKVNAVLLANLP